MGVLKGCLYLTAAVAVLTALVMGFLVIIMAGVAVGVFLSATASVVLTAGSIRGYFERR